MEGYRLRNSHGETLDPRQPLVVDNLMSRELTGVSPTITYNGKAAAGALTLNALPYKPVMSVLGDQVASYWGKLENRVYMNYVESEPKQDKTAWLLTVTETNGSAAVTIYNSTQNLEEMFESANGTVKRFVIKVTDKTGHSLYGWIRGVSVATNVYTFEVFNNRSSESNQNWVGTLASFDNTALEKVEIFRYNSSLVFATGTTLTEEVDCPKEYSKSWDGVMKYAETLSNGQYFVDYMRGRVVGVKADTTASETVNYNISAGGGGDGSAVSSPLYVQEVDAPVYEDNSNGVAVVAGAYNYTRITTATTTAVKASAGIMGGISVLAVLTGTVTIKDDTTTVGSLPIGTAVGFYPFPYRMLTSINVVTSAADSITVAYK